MASEKFRHQLRKEVEQWRNEGLITTELSEQLARRYQFEELDRIARNRFISILLGLGAILVGLALITFVAANWQALPRTFKVLLLLILFVGINSVGFYLWRTPGEHPFHRWGLGLLLLGGLILGANLALMSQMFHQSGEVYQLYLVWSLGILAMAYSLRLTSLGILSIIIAGIAYCSGIWYLFRFEAQWSQIILHMPLLASLLFIPLAYWCRSRWLFALGAILAIASLEVNLLSLIDLLPHSFTRGLIAASAASVAPALLWAYSDTWWWMRYTSLECEPISRRLAVFHLSVLVYIFSFHWWWERTSFSSYQGTVNDWSILLDLCLFLGLAVWFWWQLGRRERSGYWQLDSNSAGIAGIIIVTGWFFFYREWQAQPLAIIATIIFNLLLLLLAISSIRTALATGKRLGFWTGILLLSLQLFSRMFEYNTGLLLKSIVLFGSGVAVIFAGLWFERYLNTLNRDRSDASVE